MRTKWLATRAGLTPLLLVVLTSLFVVSGTNARPASAFAGIPLPVSLPAAIAATSAVVTSEAAVTGVTVAGGGAAAVGASPVLAVAAAALAAGSAVYIAWKWKTGHSTNYAEPTTSPGVTQNGTQYCVDNGSVFGIFYSTVNTDPATGNRSCPPPTAVSGGPWAKNLTATTRTLYWAKYLASTGLQKSSGSANLTTANPYIALGSLAADEKAWAVDVAPLPSSVPTNNAVTGIYKGTATNPGYAPGSTPVTTQPRSTCTPPGGAAHFVLGTPVTYYGGTADGALPPILAPACPAGEQRTGFDAPTTTPFGTAPAPVAPWTAPIIPSSFPECNPAGNCQLTLTEHAPDGSRTATCNGTDECAGWSTLPQLAPTRNLWDTTTGTQVLTKVPTRPDGRTYRCQWGPYELKANECMVVPTETPAEVPTTDDGSGSRGCFNGMGISPLTWPKGLVISPLKCLFIPDAANIRDDVATIKNTWTTKPPGVMIGAFTTLLAPLGGFTSHSTGSCLGPTFTLHFLGPNVDLNPFYACDGLMEKLAAVVLPLSTFLVYLGGLFAATRLVAGTIGVGMLGDD
jgi:hypothetical protein